jgi:hypothetical protein
MVQPEPSMRGCPQSHAAGATLGAWVWNQLAALQAGAAERFP